MRWWSRSSTGLHRKTRFRRGSRIATRRSSGRSTRRSRWAWTPIVSRSPGRVRGAGLPPQRPCSPGIEGGPKLCYQLLEIPEIDDRLETPSMRDFTDTPLWNRPNAVWSWRHYLGPDHQGEGVAVCGAGAGRRTCQDSRPPSVSTMEFDPLRDEGILYGLGMLQAGAYRSSSTRYAGTFHGSGLVPGADPSVRNTQEVIALLKRKLAG